MTGVRNLFRQMRRYPSAVAGSIIILFLIFMAFYAIFAIPYSDALRLWRGADNIWIQTPRNARPAWLNYFYSEKQPENIKISSIDDPSLMTVIDLGGGVSTADFEYVFLLIQTMNHRIIKCEVPKTILNVQLMIVPG